MLIKYSVDEVVERAAKQLSENSEITNFFPGSVARSLIEAISYVIGDLEDPEHHSIYGFMEQVLHQGYLSRATGEYLDLIGDLLSYERPTHFTPNEGGEAWVEEPVDDDIYRTEIAQQVTVLMTANETALRFKLLEVKGVRDVIGHEYLYGLGSFVFTIIEQEGQDSKEVLDKCRNAVLNTRAMGVRGEVQLPNYLDIDLEIHLALQDVERAQEDTPITSSEIRVSVEEAIVSYIQSLTLGEDFVYNELVSAIMSVDESIYDFEVERFDIDGEPVLLMNQGIEEDERFKAGNIIII